VAHDCWWLFSATKILIACMQCGGSRGRGAAQASFHVSYYAISCELHYSTPVMHVDTLLPTLATSTSLVDHAASQPTRASPADNALELWTRPDKPSPRRERHGDLAQPPRRTVETRLARIGSKCIHSFPELPESCFAALHRETVCVCPSTVELNGGSEHRHLHGNDTAV
jgi:hypothetical protein